MIGRESLIPKLEKTQISDSELKEKIPNFFQSFPETESASKAERNFEVNNLNISLSISENIFADKNLPKNHDELIGSNLPINDRRRLEFLDFFPEDYYKVDNLIIKNKEGKILFDSQREANGTMIFVRRDGNDPNGSGILVSCEDVKIEIEPNSPAGLFTLFHELGHINNLEKDFERMMDISIDCTKKEISENTLAIERNAWAYALQKMRPLLKDMGAKEEEMNVFIHQWALGSYSKYIEKYLAAA